MTLIELASRLGELTEAAPEHIDARAHLGSVLRESEQLQEAAAEYERAFEIGSKGPANRLRRTGRVDPDSTTGRSCEQRTGWPSCD